MATNWRDKYPGLNNHTPRRIRPGVGPQFAHGFTAVIVTLLVLFVASWRDSIKQIGVALPVVGVLLTLIAVVIQVSSFLGGRRERSLAKMGEVADATVTRLTDSMNTPITVATVVTHVHYSFSVNGTVHHGESLLTNYYATLPVVGDSVPILYDSEDVSNNMMVAAVRYTAIIRR